MASSTIPRPLNGILGNLKKIVMVGPKSSGSHTIVTYGTERTFLIIMGETYLATAILAQGIWYITVIAGNATITGSGNTVTISNPTNKMYVAFAFNGDIKSYD